MAKKIPESNNASLADIAFMLLIFFLVTTTMDVDSGVPRMLPPPVPDDAEPPPPIKERNVFKIHINSYNQVAVEEGELITDMSVLKSMVKEFFLNPADKDNYSEKKDETVDFFGNVKVSKGVVSLKNDRSTEYQRYLEVQDIVVAAIAEMRNELAQRKFKMDFKDLSDKKQDAIQKIHKLAISEAEPRDLAK